MANAIAIVGFGVLFLVVVGPRLRDRFQVLDTQDSTARDVADHAGTLHELGRVAALGRTGRMCPFCGGPALIGTPCRYCGTAPPVAVVPRPAGLITSAHPITQQQAHEIKKRFMAASAAREVVVLGPGLAYHPLPEVDHG